MHAAPKPGPGSRNLTHQVCVVCMCVCVCVCKQVVGWLGVRRERGKEITVWESDLVHIHVCVRLCVRLS